jgi:hypothetical protein
VFWLSHTWVTRYGLSGWDSSYWSGEKTGSSLKKRLALPWATQIDGGRVL